MVASRVNLDFMERTVKIHAVIVNELEKRIVIEKRETAQSA